MEKNEYPEVICYFAGFHLLLIHKKYLLQNSVIRLTGIMTYYEANIYYNFTSFISTMTAELVFFLLIKESQGQF